MESQSNIKALAGLLNSDDRETIELGLAILSNNKDVDFRIKIQNELTRSGKWKWLLTSNLYRSRINEFDGEKSNWVDGNAERRESLRGQTWLIRGYGF